MRDFLDAPFEFPEVCELVRKSHTPEIAGVGDADTLRRQNVALSSELTETKGQLDDEKRKLRILSNERNSLKRKALHYVELRKRFKAEHERVKYWQKTAEGARVDTSAVTERNYLERQKKQLETRIEHLESQVHNLQLELADSRKEKVSEISSFNTKNRQKDRQPDR